jgi:low affinity Fe/Cu permease
VQTAEPFGLPDVSFGMRASLPVRSYGGGSSSANGSLFGRFANATARLTGKPAAFLIATATVVVWAITGPIFHYSDTWQLVINTGTTIITFLMVFLIQNTQNRDTLALQVKLDELILATKAASNELVNIEEASEERLTTLKKDEAKRAKKRC